MCPTEITDSIRQFANRITGRDDLVYVPVNQQPEALVGRCYYNVAHAVRLHGGEIILGFCFWTIRNLFLTAEHHAIWQRSDGTLVDPTPQPLPTSRILFVPSDKRHIHAHYHLLVDHPLIRQVVTLLDIESVALARQRRSGREDGVRWNNACNKMVKLLDRYYEQHRKKKSSLR